MHSWLSRLLVSTLFFFFKASRATLLFSATIVTYYKNIVHLLWIETHCTINDIIDIEYLHCRRHYSACGGIVFAVCKSKRVVAARPNGVGSCWTHYRRRTHQMVLGHAPRRTHQHWVLPPEGPKTFFFFSLIFFHTVKREIIDGNFFILYKN